MKICEVQPDDYSRVADAAYRDNHSAFAATHYLQNDKAEIVGAASIGGITLVTFWSDTRNHAITSFRWAKGCREIAKKFGRPVATMVQPNSPFQRMMPMIDFCKTSPFDFYVLREGAR
jgi:hypothetical protein